MCHTTDELKQEDEFLSHISSVYQRHVGIVRSLHETVPGASDLDELIN